MYDDAIQYIYHWDDVQNKPIKKILVCEFITGGGFNHSDLRPALIEQGQQMRDALLSDLTHLPYHIITTGDARLVPAADCNVYYAITIDDDVWQVWEEIIRTVDAVWFIAPETDGYLERVTSLVLKHNKIMLGCGLTSIAVCSSKLATYQLLKQAGLATLETYLYATWDKASGIKWLAKPDDGAGCEETVCFNTAEHLERWILQNDKGDTYIIQPYLEGNAASISCVMHDGKAHVLSCNKQLITLEDNLLVYKGCIVNGMMSYWKAFEVLANQIAQLLPDLSGYVGIDLIVNHSDAPLLTIVEINPRLTTSYAGLQAATGESPAKLIMNTLTQDNFRWPAIQKNEVLLETTHA